MTRRAGLACAVAMVALLGAAVAGAVDNGDPARGERAFQKMLFLPFARAG